MNTDMDIDMDMYEYEKEAGGAWLALNFVNAVVNLYSLFVTALYNRSMFCSVRCVLCTTFSNLSERLGR